METKIKTFTMHSSKVLLLSYETRQYSEPLH